MMRGLLHAELVSASQHAQHPASPSLPVDHRFTEFTPLEHSIQHQNLTSPTLSQDVTRITAEPSDTELTPPTSSSGFSSQERAISASQDVSTSASGSVEGNTFHALVSKSLAESPKSTGNLDSIATPKRTSDGQIKRPSATDADIAKKNDDGTSRRSRTSSLLSSGSNVTEVGFPEAQYQIDDLTSPAAVTTVAYSPLICYGKGSEWLGVE
jgi:hypothetical protein